MKINTTSLASSVPITVPAAASEKLVIVIPTQKFKLNYIEEEVLNRISQLYSDIYSLYLTLLFKVQDFLGEAWQAWREHDCLRQALLCILP